MSPRAKIILGQALGLGWALAILWLPLRQSAGFLPINTALIGAFLPPGLVLMVLTSAIAMRRLIDDETLLGGALPPDTRAATDQRVLFNTLEQLVLAMALWPFVALTLGGHVVLWLGGGFAAARLLYWLGYHVSPLLKSIGFGGTFYPTVLATLWAIFKWAT